MALKFKLALPKTTAVRRKPTDFEDSFLFKESKKQIVAEIQEVMDLDGITRLTLARRLGAQASAVTQALKINRGMQLTTLVRIADVLGCQLEVNLIRRGTIVIATAADFSDEQFDRM